MVRERLRRLARHALRAVLFAIALVYFLIDLLFLSVLRPVRRWLLEWRLLEGLRAWVASLNRYAALLLLVVPWLLLEPVKPVALYLFAHHHSLAATTLIVGGEVIKLTLLDQVFHMTKPKLLTFPWFARGYARWEMALAYLRSLPAWRRVRSWYRVARAWLLLWARRLRRRVIAAGTEEPR